MKRSKITMLLSSMGACIALLAGSQVQAADEFPTKPIKFVVPFDAGGTADIPARIVARCMSKYSAKPVQVVNIVGAAGSIGAREVMKASPDGYTVLHIPAGFPQQYAMGTIDFTYENFEPITIWLESYLAFVVKADSKYKTFAEFVSAAKANPGSIKVGSVTGTLPMFAMLNIEHQTGIDLNIVDLAIGAKAPELLSGRVEAYIDGFGGVKPFVKAGQFRSLGVFADKRIKGSDDIPTFKELGLKDVTFLNQPFGMWAPKGTPADRIAYLEGLVKKVSEDPTCTAEIEKLGADMAYVPRDKYIGVLKETYDSFKEFAKIVKTKN